MRSPIRQVFPGIPSGSFGSVPVKRQPPQPRPQAQAIPAAPVVPVKPEPMIGNPFQRGQFIGVVPISVAQSNDRIHYGTHKSPGVYDLTPRAAKRAGISLADAQVYLSNRGFIVAYRRPGQRGIKSEHLHFADPILAPDEAKRLLSQTVGIMGSYDFEDIA